MKKKVLSSLMVMGLSAAMIGGATFAWFTDSATNTANTFTAGTLKIAVNGHEVESYTYNFSVDGKLQPGDIVTKTSAGAKGKSEIVIENTGNLDLALFNRLELTDSVDDGVNLADALYFTDYSMEFLNWDESPYRPAGDYQVDNFITDEKFKDGPSGDAVKATAGADGKLSLSEFANNNWDIAGGWDIDSLKPGSKIKLTYQIKFNEGAGNEYQGKSVQGQWVTKARQLNEKALQDEFPGTYSYLVTNLATQKNK